MNFKLILLMCSIYMILFSGCFSTSDFDDFYKVSKKTSQNDFVEKYDNKIQDTLVLTVNNEIYTIYFVDIKLASNQRYGNLHPNENFNFYCFAFKNNHFFYSGYLFEFMRNIDSNIRIVGNEIYDNLVKEDE